MINNHLITQIERNFGFKPTSEQHFALQKLADFLLYAEPDSLLLLKGYAGTGKSTLIAEVRKSLPDNWSVAFCAFTGKATSVMKEKLIKVNALNSNDVITTIHSLCYSVREDPDTKQKVFPTLPTTA